MSQHVDSIRNCLITRESYVFDPDLDSRHSRLFYSMSFTTSFRYQILSNLKIHELVWLLGLSSDSIDDKPAKTKDITIPFSDYSWEKLIRFVIDLKKSDEYYLRGKS